MQQGGTTGFSIAAAYRKHGFQIALTTFFHHLN
jgi:hypothetical protein